MQVKLSQIESEFKDLFEGRTGKDVEVTGIAPVGSCGTGDLVFIARADLAQPALDRQPTAVIVGPDDAAAFESAGIPTLVSRRVGLAHARVRQAYADRDVRDSEWGRVHASAVVHESASLGRDVVIGPAAVVGRDVKLADRVVVMAGTVIEYESEIGAGTVIHPNCVLGYRTKVGCNVIIKSGSVIGMEGFGFEQDEQKRSHRIPQTGRVVIEDDVVIGASNCIDRATYAETRIGRGTKMDNLCHLAHNVRVGEDCLLTAALVVAGSTEIGNRVITSGQSGFLDHLKVCDDTIFVHRAGITADVTEPGIYAGLPVQPLQSYLKNTALLARLTDMRKQVRDLEKQVKALGSAPA